MTAILFIAGAVTGFALGVFLMAILTITRMVGEDDFDERDQLWDESFPLPDPLDRN